jgi:hypothetical protein
MGIKTDGMAFGSSLGETKELVMFINFSPAPQDGNGYVPDG